MLCAALAGSSKQVASLGHPGIRALFHGSPRQVQRHVVSVREVCVWRCVQHSDVSTTGLCCRAVASNPIMYALWGPAVVLMFATE